MIKSEYLPSIDTNAFLVVCIDLKILWKETTIQQDNYRQCVMLLM